MKLEIVNETKVAPGNVMLLNDAFVFACKKLGISAEPWTVKLEVLDIDRDFEAFGMLYIERADGATSSIVRDNTIRMRIVDAHDNDPLHTFFHEMIHAADTITGRLGFDEATEDGIWEGQRFHKNGADMAHDDRPWERRAIDVSEVLRKEFDNEYRVAA